MFVDVPLLVHRVASIQRSYFPLSVVRVTDGDSCFVPCCTFTFTYPLTPGVVGAPQMTPQPVSSIFLCSPLPSGPVPSLILSSNLFLSALSSPFHCALQDGFGQT